MALTGRGQRIGTLAAGTVVVDNVDVRPRGPPAAVGVAVPELNLRTYSSPDGASGLYFFSLDAAGLETVVGARVTHHLPYFYARIRMGPGVDVVTRRSKRWGARARRAVRRPAD